MKKMCLVVLTALIIIICVIAFQTLRESKEEVFDGILIEENMDRAYHIHYGIWDSSQKMLENGGVL